MKKFTDIFICRPVLAIVVSLLVFVLGMKSILDLQVREYPKMDSTLITITTTYPGAPADLVEGFITKRIEESVASAEGIDYMDSTSIDGVSTISVHVKLNFDPNTAFTDVMSKAQQVQSDLPSQAQLPIINKSSDAQTALMYIGFNSDRMTPQQITDYISRVVQPKLETIYGVSQAQILGGKTFAMRVWLDSKRMASLGVTPTDVANALTSNNFQSAAGKTKGDYVQLSITAETDVQDPTAFDRIVVKTVNGTLIRIRDIGKVELGSDTYDSSVYFDGKKAIFVAVSATPSANPLTVIGAVKKMLPELKKIYPPTLSSKVAYDATKYINASIEDVIKTIIEAGLIVIVVIFCFLGSLRSVIIPVVTIPLSLVGVCFFMFTLGYSLNLLTLLAMVLAIGLVVDDAIVVVENIQRYIERGLTPFQASIKGMREIATPIISMTITLAAVYAPIGFMTGLTGALFKEFAFTLAGSVVVSGLIAVTLSPVMCSVLLTSEMSSGRLVKFIDTKFEALKNRYERLLNGSLNYRPVGAVVAITVLVSCFVLYATTKSELAPTEDQGVVFALATAPQYANINYVEAYTDTFQDVYNTFKSKEDDFIINGMNSQVNSVMSALIMKPWDDRTQSQAEALKELQAKLGTVAGVRTVAFPLPSLPGSGGGLPIQFVLTSISPFTEIFPISQQLKQKAMDSGLFMYVESTLQYDKPELKFKLNRSKAGDLGINMQDIGGALAYSLGGNYINWFSMEGQSYKVIPQLSQKYRLNPQDVQQIYVRTGSGDTIPLSTIMSVRQVSQPNALTHFQQLNSATIQGVLAPGVTTGQALKYLQEQAKEILPPGMTYDYSGGSRQYIEEGNALIITLFLALIVIYLVLSAQFESFRDPFVVLISVPLSICGALIPLFLGMATINIYTQIGLITLVGLISKHGILMVEFANQLQEEEGLTVRQAIEKAAGIRLRPILMTTAAMVFGMIPLMIASGAGAASRHDIGVVIFFGMLIGTCFTLFIVPTMYTFFAKSHVALRMPDDDL
jgi:multidrug efflux pump